MGGCAAMNCSNSDKKGFKMYRFPADSERRNRWTINCRRENFTPGPSSQLCEVHFEESQFELNRVDGKRKLAVFAIPTINFNVPNPPKPIDVQPRKSLYKNRDCEVPPSTALNLNPRQVDNNCPGVSNHINSENQCSKCNVYLQEIMKLRQEKADLIKRVEEAEKVVQKVKLFLNDDQVYALTGRVEEWSNETIIKSLKLRFALGVYGYQYLRSTNYPAPGYSTLTRRMREYKITGGIFKSIQEPLKFKIQMMEPRDRFCMISIDEMEIDKKLAFDKNAQKIFGHVTIGKPEDMTTILASKLLVVLIRGVKTNWKQIIACHFTDGKLKAIHLRPFIEDCIKFCQTTGLTVVAFSSDMGSENRGLWTNFGISVRKEGLRLTHVKSETNNIHFVADVCHLLKNLKSALLNAYILLPKHYCDKNNLPTQRVDASYVKLLWNREVDEKKEMRLLYHLNREDIFPDNYQRMHVGAAVRFFSLKTATAIEFAVEMKILPEIALTTAHFIRLIESWFSLMNSRLRKTSITKKNCEQKYEFLENIIAIAEEMIVGGDTWKPLNVGMVLSTLSFIDICEFLFANNYDFVIGHRFTQDATENIFSQVRRKAGATPNAVQCLRSLKTISISQYISDVQNNNYLQDSDHFLLNFFNKPANCIQQPNNVIYTAPVNNFPSDEKFGTRSVEDLINCKVFDMLDCNHLFYIAGSAEVSVCKSTLCDNCKEFLSEKVTEDFFPQIQKYTQMLDKGGLKMPSPAVLHLIFNCEVIRRQYKMFILHNSAKILIGKIVQDVEVQFPNCPCNIKEKIVQHFFAIRVYNCTNLSSCAKRKKMFGTASAKKKKTQ